LKSIALKVLRVAHASMTLLVFGAAVTAGLALYVVAARSQPTQE
jgi:hypothetical protein